jgi:adenylate cyclase
MVAAVNIRLKVMAVTGALLAIFAASVLAGVLLQDEVTAELGAITEYHSPITALVAEADVLTFELELVLYRLMRQTGSSPEAIGALSERHTRIAARLREVFARAIVLLDQGIADRRSDESDRLIMARAQGVLRFLWREVDPLIAVGERVRAALAAGQRAEAEALVAQFDRFAKAFGPDVAEVREAMAALNASSTQESADHLRRGLLLGTALFGVAALGGIAISAAFAGRLQKALRRLIDGTRAVESGQFTVTVQVTSRDEIGELARGFNHMQGELRARERIKDTFGQYVDPRIVASLIDPSGDTLDTAERRPATVFFSDIQGFSAMSEQLTASAMVKLLNQYFTEASAAVRAHQGIIDKYIGDSVMAFWTAPFSTGDSHAADACRAALAQQRAVAELHGRLPEILGLRKNVPDLVVRMGLATGEVVVGTIGSPTAKSYTVIGDTVNIASRLEGANKAYHTRILLAEETYRLAQHAVEARELDFALVVGKSEPIRVYELLASHGELAALETELCGLFAEGLAAYRAQDWARAGEAFGRCRRLRPDDGPARVFEERVALLKAAPPPAGWDGVWRLAHK